MNHSSFSPSSRVARWLTLAALTVAGMSQAAAADGAPPATGNDQTNTPGGVVIGHQKLSDNSNQAPDSAALALASVRDGAEQSFTLMQSKAPEALVIKILSVKTSAAASAPGSTVPPGSLVVTAQALVISSSRTATKLQAADKIIIFYGYLPDASGNPGPLTVPLVKVDGEYEAYLSGGPSPSSYAGAAASRTFIDHSSGPMNGPGDKAAAPVANPDFLPTPQNPAPTAVTKLAVDSLYKSATTSQESGHWTVALASFKDALPLQTIGNATPVLLDYYLPNAHAPLTQPSVLVYLAGTQLAHNSATDLVTVERALIIDDKGRVLGNVLWATRPQKAGLFVPLPIWHWTTSSLDVEDPTEHDIQHVPLTFTPEIKAATPAINVTTPDAKAPDKK